MDTLLFHFFNDSAGQHPVADAFMIACAKGLPYVFALVLVSLWFTWKRSLQIGGTLAATAGFLGLVLAQIIIRVAPRLRPYDVTPSHLLVERTPDPSFPSDHATLAFAVALVIWQCHRRLGRWLMVVAVLQAVSRVYVGAHYPLDVAGGAVLGGASGLIIWHLSRTKPGERALNQIFAVLNGWRLASKEG